MTRPLSPNQDAKALHPQTAFITSAMGDNNHSKWHASLFSSIYCSCSHEAQTTHCIQSMVYTVAHPTIIITLCLELWTSWSNNHYILLCVYYCIIHNHTKSRTYLNMLSSVCALSAIQPLWHIFRCKRIVTQNSQNSMLVSKCGRMWYILLFLVYTAFDMLCVSTNAVLAYLIVW